MRARSLWKDHAIAPIEVRRLHADHPQWCGGHADRMRCSCGDHDRAAGTDALFPVSDVHDRFAVDDEYMFGMCAMQMRLHLSVDANEKGGRRAVRVKRAYVDGAFALGTGE